MSISSNKGFTLIELLIAITILVILLTLAGPSFVDNLDRRSLINATQSLSDQIQLARSTAIVRNQPIIMVFDEDDGDWCFGFTDRATGCNCIVNDVEAANACTVGVAQPAPDDTDEERFLTSMTNSDFARVTLNLPSSPNLTFEPTRGLLNLGLAAGVPRFVEYEIVSDRNRTTRVSVNIIGRVNRCAADNALLGGIQECL